MKKILPDLLVILAFALLSFAYFFPADIEGRILFQHDTAAGAGAGQEALSYLQETGERTRWTNSLFGGMPTYQISPSYDSTQPLEWGEKLYRLFLPDYVQLTFILLTGFYLLLRAFGISVWLAGLGSVMWAFSSYFFILISAGHLWKLITLAYIPPTLAGIVMTYRGKLLAGGVITALFLAMQIHSNHVQMSYYFGFVILFMVAAYFVQTKLENALPRFFKATAVLAVAALIGVAANLSNLYHTYTYSKETMRGKSELVQTGEAAKQTSSGLDRDYITQWSYGIGETWTLLVPNFKGGASSAALSQSEAAMKKANPMYGSLYASFPQYFGTQPFTAGPVYVGAFVLCLFVLGCFVVKGPMKWALLGATVLSILLSWGKNFMPLTDFFIDFIPMYSKFRAVSSILVIAEFTIPLLAILALRQVLDHPAELLKEKKAIAASLLLTAGVALLLYVAPESFGSGFVTPNETAMLQNAVNQQMIPASELNGIMSSLSQMRAAMVSADALRSLIIILAGVALTALFLTKKLGKELTVAGIALLCLVDMWGVNKRYLNDAQFVPRSITTETFAQSEADKQILQSDELDYRVLRIASNSFDENNTSYWHKSVGGYHAAKLRRYQELIDHYIRPEMNGLAEFMSRQGNFQLEEYMDRSQISTLNMLNTAYFIAPTSQGDIAVKNPYAYGNAWFVEQVEYVNNANEELDALAELGGNDCAVVDKRFQQTLKGATTLTCDSLATIRLTSYQPNHLVYETDNNHEGVAVFSEIYYPDGWKVTIDGESAELARANYVLRTLYIPAGKHRIEMRFDPESLHITETIAYAASALLVVGIMLLLLKWRKKSI